MVHQLEVAQYEYKVMPFETRHLSTNELNILGREGWLLVSTIPNLILARAVAANHPAATRPKLLRIKEAAEDLNSSRSKLYELMRGNIIESIRIGRSVRIPQAAIARFLENQ